MKDRTDFSAEADDPNRQQAGGETPSGDGFNWADEDVPQRGPRADGEGSYDLSWDGVSGGCATDES